MNTPAVLRAAIAVNMFAAAGLVAQWDLEDDEAHADVIERLFDENRVVKRRLQAQLRRAQES